MKLTLEESIREELRRYYSAKCSMHPMAIDHRVDDAVDRLALMLAQALYDENDQPTHSADMAEGRGDSNVE